MSCLEELVKSGAINESQIDEIKNLAKDKYAGDIEDALLATGISEDILLKAKGEFLQMPTRKVDLKGMSFSALKYIPEDSATYYQFAPIGFVDGVLEVGVTDPENIQAMDALQFISAKLGIPFKIFLISKSDYEGIMNTYKGISGQVEEALDELNQDQILDTKKAGANLDKEIKNTKSTDEAKIVEDAPVIKIVAVILRNAIESGASDIHIEHTGESVKVRFRVDGTLHTGIVLPTNVYSGIIARIKIISKLRLDEKRKPQDGSFSTSIDGRKIDFRVSTLPAYYGEKIAMRLLDAEKGVKALDQLGLSTRNLAMIKEAIAKPYGLILITGPTGSGKSTTLYSMMNELDKEKSNIVSLEDPVEYHMPNINQSQIMPEIGYTFASGLRSILRQDPDIIMVGEIRDKETAMLAVQAALTGHLVLSTLHTNNAIGVIPRLIDMGVDPYLIGPTLTLAVAQRLVRAMCEESKDPVTIEDSVKVIIDKQLAELPEKRRKEIKLGKEVFRAKRSPTCPGGTRGRVGVYEMFEIDKDVERLVLENPSETTLEKFVRGRGMLTMKDDALLKALSGVIPFEEVSTL